MVRSLLDHHASSAPGARVKLAYGRSLAALLALVASAADWRLAAGQRRSGTAHPVDLA
jgi:hypothetical protein